MNRNNDFLLFLLYSLCNEQTERIQDDEKAALWKPRTTVGRDPISNEN